MKDLTNKSDSEIVSAYIKVVYFLAKDCAKSSSDIDDIVQNVFLNYLVSKPKFENEKAANRWFDVVTTRVAINFYGTKHYKYVIDVTDEEYESVQSRQDFIEEVENKVATEEQLALLSPLSRKILFWHFDCGMSIQKIAWGLGESVDKTKNLLRKAIREYRGIVLVQEGQENVVREELERDKKNKRRKPRN